jgi:DNA-nicking Smr family endonuclease
MKEHGSRKGRRLSKDEDELWDSVTRSIRPLRKRAPKPSPEIAEEKPVPRLLRKSAAKIAVKTAALPQSSKPAAPPPLAAIDRRTKQKIARGKHEIDGRIDLHGHTQHEAHTALLRFLRSAQAKGGKVVLVITGKGVRGDHGRERGVLRRQVPLWLALPEFRDYVVGFDEAAIGHGGEGALYVRLRKKRA